MSIPYVRARYRMPWLKRGLRVLAMGKPGVVTRATAHVYVRLDGERRAKPYHPHDVTREVREYETAADWLNIAAAAAEDPELLALAQEAVDRMNAHAACRANMTPEELEEDNRKQREAQVNWILHGPGGD